MTRILRPKVILPAALLLTLTLYLVIAFAMVYGATRPDHRPFEAHPDDFGLQYEDVSFVPRDGTLTLRGWLFAGSPGAPYLIFVHGIGDQRTGQGAVDLASRLVQEAGYNILVFDLRAQGTSDGSILTAGELERNDVLGAYDFVLTRGAQPGQVGLIGRSFGAAIAIMAAPHEQGIAAIVADSPFADVQDLIAQETARKTSMPKTIVRTLMPPARLFADLLYDIDLGGLQPERDVARLDYPVFIIHGEADERIPLEHGLRVYAAAPPGSTLWTLPGVEHTASFRTHPDEYVQRVKAYLSTRFQSGSANGNETPLIRDFLDYRQTNGSDSQAENQAIVIFATQP